MQKQDSADIIIVGGGIIGLSTAFYLSQRNFGRILVLERDHIGMGSTGQSVASIEPLAFFPTLATLQRHSIEIYKNFKELIGGDCGFQSVPLVMFVKDKYVPAMYQAIKTGKEAGSDVFEIEIQEFLKSEPNTKLDGVGAIYGSKDSGFADPMLTLNGFVHAAKQLGVTIYQQTPVQNVRTSGGRVVGVETPIGTFSAPTVLLATGLWADQLLNSLGLSSGVNFFRHFVVPIEAPPSAPQYMIWDTELDFYSRPENRRNMYLIGTGVKDDGDYKDIYDQNVPPPNVSQEMALSVLERVVKRFPVMENARLHKGAYTGVAAMSPDKHPLLGILPIQGLFLAAGMSGIGFKIGPGVGKAMAELIDGDHYAAKLLAPLRPTRITENQLLIPENEFALLYKPL